MICYNCMRVNECSAFKELYKKADDFCINNCKEFEKTTGYKYRKIGENDDLMHLIYDYFLDNIDYRDFGHNEEDVKDAIKRALLEM